jgi:ferredoxin, 2Fe-2S
MRVSRLPLLRGDWPILDMPHVTYIQPDGVPWTIDVPIGQSIMRGAHDNNVAGIIAECGGSAMCATCHVYVDPAFTHVLPAVAPAENAMLEMTASERRESSRLSCQLMVTADYAGIIVQIPPTQV